MHSTMKDYYVITLFLHSSCEIITLDSTMFTLYNEKRLSFPCLPQVLNDTKETKLLNIYVWVCVRLLQILQKKKS